jgi:hypothetical protein
MVAEAPPRLVLVHGSVVGGRRSVTRNLFC